MPIYTCTTTKSTLTSDVKVALAGEVARIHSAINHVPSTYVNVVFHELPADAIYTDGRPAAPVLVSGWVRAGPPRPKPPALPPRSPRPSRGCPVFPPTECWSCSKAAQRVSPSRAVGCFPSQAKNKPGFQGAEYLT